MSQGYLGITLAMNRLDLGDYEPKEMPGVGVPRVTSVSAELTKITLDTTVLWYMAKVL